MLRWFHLLVPGSNGGLAAVAVAVVLLSWSCGRTIEEEEPPELIEHRVEPCTQWCTAMQSPECGRIDDPQPFETAEECIVDCAGTAPVYAWSWARQGDGTDGCAEEWFAVAACMDALTCEEQRAYFRRPPTSTDFPCKEELEARSYCFRTTPSLERLEEDT